MKNTIGMEAKGKKFFDFQESMFKHFLVNFINSKDNDSAFEIFLSFLDEVTNNTVTESSLTDKKILNKEYQGSLSSFIKEYSHEVRQEVADKVKDYRILIEKMMAVAVDESLEHHLIEPNGAEIYSKNTPFEISIQEHLSPLYKKVIWRGKGYTGMSIEVNSKYANPVFYSEQLLAEIVMTLIKGLDKRNPIANKYINYCPQCRSWFVKNRKDQVFCTEKCRKKNQNNRINAESRRKRIEAAKAKAEMKS